MRIQPATPLSVAYRDESGSLEGYHRFNKYRCVEACLYHNAEARNRVCEVVLSDLAFSGITSWVGVRAASSESLYRQTSQIESSAFSVRVIHAALRIRSTEVNTVLYCSAPLARSGFHLKAQRSDTVGPHKLWRGHTVQHFHVLLVLSYSRSDANAMGFPGAKLRNLTGPPTGPLNHTAWDGTVSLLLAKALANYSVLFVSARVSHLERCMTGRR